MITGRSIQCQCEKRITGLTFNEFAGIAGVAMRIYNDRQSGKFPVNKRNKDSKWDDDAEYSTGEGYDLDNVKIYLREAGFIPLLKSHDERVLGRKIEIGRHLSWLKDELSKESNLRPAAIDLLLFHEFQIGLAR